MTGLSAVRQAIAPYLPQRQPRDLRAAHLTGLLTLTVTLLAMAAALWLGASPVSAQAPTQDWSTWGDVAAPLMWVSPEGQANFLRLDARVEYSPNLKIMLETPDRLPSVIADLGQVPPQDVMLALGPGQNPAVAWLVPLSDTMRLCVAPLTDTSSVTCYETPKANTVALAIGDDGHPYQAWYQDGEIVVLDAALGMTRTLEMDNHDTPESLQLTIAKDGLAHLIWSAREPGEDMPTAYYGNTLGDTLPVTITKRAVGPKLTLDGDGGPHVVWHDGIQLLYAHGPDWDEADVVVQATGISAWDIAASSDEDVTVAWASVNGLWTAHLLNWSLTRRPILRTEQVGVLTLGLDTMGYAHLLWQETDSESTVTWGYWADDSAARQIRIVYPFEGDRLTAGDTLYAQTMPQRGWQQVSFYLEPVDTSTAGTGWIPVGTDTDGGDGWSASLPESTTPGRYRVTVLGVSAKGATRCATGPQITMGPDIGGQVAFVTASQAPLRGNSQIRMIWLPATLEETTAMTLDVYLRAESWNALPATGQVDAAREPASLHYVGQHTLHRPANASTTPISFDSRAVPDGTYTVLPREADTGIWWPADSQPIRIDNSMVPHISLLEPEPGVLHDQVLPIAVSAEDPNGLIERIDFFLARGMPLMETPHEAVEAPRRIWVGADDSPQGGWSIDLAIQDSWRGHDWRILAKASDTEGNTSMCSSDAEVQFASSPPAFSVLSPTSQESLRGMESIVIAGPETTSQIAITAYLLNEADHLYTIGNVEAVWPGWQTEWDTTAFADGSYQLQFDIVPSDKRSGELLLSPWFTINNQMAEYAFAEPASDAVLSGTELLRMRETGAPAPLQRVSFYWRDDAGAMGLIARDTSSGDGWGALWNTWSVLDGAYDIVALSIDASGQQSYWEIPITVQNNTPVISLDVAPGAYVAGVQEIQWAMPAYQATVSTVSIAYSPDDGRHWQELASRLPVDEPWPLDSRALPDSPLARLRVVASNGSSWAQDVSARFVVDNENEPPIVSLLAPESGQTYAQGELVVAWEVTDPDLPEPDETLQIDLEYRIQGSGWRTIRYDLDPQGAFLWNDHWLEPAKSYDLRLVARDEDGASASDAVRSIQLKANHPPSIRLLWPNSPVELDGEAIILWQAEDPDGDFISIDLYYSDNGGQAWLPLAQHLTNTGYYSWQLAYLPPSDQYRLRAIASDGTSIAASESPSAFSVGDQHQTLITLLSPRPGATLQGLQWVRWGMLEGIVPNQAKIETRRDGTSAWEQMAMVTNQEHYLWDTRELRDGAYDLRVTISDTTGIARVASPEPLKLANRSSETIGVELISPLGGETWYGTRQIRWRALGTGQEPLTASLSISADLGQTWQTIGQTDGRYGHYLWHTDDLTDTKAVLCSITISDGQHVARSTTSSQVNLLNAPSRPPRVQLLERWEDGTLLEGDTLAWRAYDPDFDPVRISLWQSQSAGKEWASVSQHLANTGLSVLDLPYLDRETWFGVTATDGLWTVQSNIVPARPYLPESVRADMTFLSPRAGQILSGESEVSWQADAPAGTDWHVSLEYSANGGLTWTSIAQQLELDQRTNWDTSRLENGVYRLRLSLVSDRAQQSLVSPAFIVHNPDARPSMLTMLSPAGSGIWSGLQDIRWYARDGQGNELPVDLSYSVDQGTSWTAIARNVRNGGSYTWDTTRAPNCDQVWLKAAAEIGGQERQAVSSEPVTIWNLVSPAARVWFESQGSRFLGEPRVSWQAQSQTGQPVAVAIDFSTDEGSTWQNLGRNLPSQGSLPWDTSTLPLQTQAIVRLRAADRGLTAIDTLWEPIIVQDKRPTRLPPLLAP